MRAFEVVALIIGIFFVVGIVVGFLAVMAIPALGQAWANRNRRWPVDGFHPDPRDQPDPGPPAADTQPLPPLPLPREPDDRDDYPWWPGQR